MNSCRRAAGSENKRNDRNPSGFSVICSARWALVRSKVGGVRSALEQRRLVAIFAADVVGYSHAAYEQIYYSSLMPRTYLCARLLETLD
jgi:hypothetical protein